VKFVEQVLVITVWERRGGKFANYGSEVSEGANWRKRHGIIWTSKPSY
jgi:hypothetical protein